MGKLARYLLCAALLWVAACAKKAPPEPEPPNRNVAEEKPQDRPSGRWQLRELQVELQLDDDQREPGVTLAALQDAVTASLAKLEQVRGVGSAEGVALRDQVAVHVQIAWQRVSEDFQPQPLATAGNANLLVQIVAHAEMPGERPSENRLAERSQRVMLPMPGSLDDRAKWLRDRATQAAVVAVADVLGELWANTATEAELQACLDSPQTWQVQAAAREVGERRLLTLRPRLEKLARDSRKDVAVVSAAALGRLGEAASVPLLVGLLESGQIEVVDAVLVSLSTMPAPEARAALVQAAASHPSQFVRKRARQLLGNGGGAELDAAATPSAE